MTYSYAALLFFELNDLLASLTTVAERYVVESETLLVIYITTRIVYGDVLDLAVNNGVVRVHGLFNFNGQIQHFKHSFKTDHRLRTEVNAQVYIDVI